jgi:molecular chaperone GrpE
MEGRDVAPGEPGAGAPASAAPAPARAPAPAPEPHVAPVEPAPEAPAAGVEAVEAHAEDGEAQLQRERDEYLALAQRTQADFDNFRKRAVRDRAVSGARAKAELVRELLPVVDNLERALQTARDGEQDLAAGVRLVLAELTGVLQRTGVEPIDAQRQTFDPTVHDALSTRVEEGADPGVVIEVVEKGYRLGESVIRPARVVVSA